MGRPAAPRLGGPPLRAFLALGLARLAKCQPQTYGSSAGGACYEMGVYPNFNLCQACTSEACTYLGSDGSGNYICGFEVCQQSYPPRPGPGVFMGYSGCRSGQTCFPAPPHPPPPVPATPFGGRLPSAWVTNFSFRAEGGATGAPAAYMFAGSDTYVLAVNNSADLWAGAVLPPPPPVAPPSPPPPVQDYVGRRRLQQSAPALAIYPPVALASASGTVSGQAYGNGAYVTTASSNADASYKAFASGMGWYPNGAHYATANGLYGPATNIISTPGYPNGDWLQITLPLPVYLRAYTIQARPSPNSNVQTPCAWTVLGSNDAGTTWTSLVTDGFPSCASAPSAGTGQNFTVPWTTTLPYSTFRLIITGIFLGSNGWTAIGAWNLYASVVATPAPPPIAPPPPSPPSIAAFQKAPIMYIPVSGASSFSVFVQVRGGGGGGGLRQEGGFASLKPPKARWGV